MSHQLPVGFILQPPVEVETYATDAASTCDEDDSDEAVDRQLDISVANARLTLRDDVEYKKVALTPGLECLIKWSPTVEAYSSGLIALERVVSLLTVERTLAEQSHQLTNLPETERSRQLRRIAREAHTAAMVRRIHALFGQWTLRPTHRQLACFATHIGKAVQVLHCQIDRALSDASEPLVFRFDERVVTIAATEYRTQLKAACGFSAPNETFHLGWFWKRTPTIPVMIPSPFVLHAPVPTTVWPNANLRTVLYNIPPDKSHADFRNYFQKVYREVIPDPYFGSLPYPPPVISADDVVESVAACLNRFVQEAGTSVLEGNWSQFNVDRGVFPAYLTGADEPLDRTLQIDQLPLALFSVPLLQRLQDELRAKHRGWRIIISSHQRPDVDRIAIYPDVVCVGGVQCPPNNFEATMAFWQSDSSTNGERVRSENHLP